MTTREYKGGSLLGLTVRDTITGFEGTAVERCEQLSGEIGYRVQPRGLRGDGAPIETQYFDQGRLRVVDGERVAGFKDPEGTPKKKRRVCPFCGIEFQETENRDE